MAYSKMVETIPVERRKTLSDKLINAILASKNDEKMSSGLANTILYHSQRDLLAEDTGLATLLEAAILLESEKTMGILEEELRLMDTAKAVKELLAKAGK